MLDEYHWPGNVRELENTIERALALAREGIVTKAKFSCIRHRNKEALAGLIKCP
jgi:transcriptional regulator with GAF, ATPase, and Fis domain